MLARAPLQRVASIEPKLWMCSKSRGWTTHHGREQRCDPSFGCSRLFCPVPVAEAKQALSSMEVGSVLQVLASDPETLHDIPLMLGRTPHELLSVESNAGEYTFLIEVKGND